VKKGVKCVPLRFPCNRDTVLPWSAKSLSQNLQGAEPGREGRERACVLARRSLKVFLSAKGK